MRARDPAVAGPPDSHPPPLEALRLMALSTVELSLASDPLPGNVADFILESQRRIDQFTESRRSEPIPAFVPSDFVAAYRTLAAIGSLGLSTGHLFCEWGSGFGVVTGLAAMAEFDACGIEIEPLLVEEARRLVEDFHLPCEFACGSFIPDEADEIALNPSELAWLSTDAPDAYADLQLNVDDFDIVYAYPWPDEQDILGELFDQFASEGALLCTFESPEEILVRRKVRRRRR